MCKLIMRGRVFIYLLVAFVIVGVGVQSTAREGVYLLVMLIVTEHINMAYAMCVRVYVC